MPLEPLAVQAEYAGMLPHQKNPFFEVVIEDISPKTAPPSPVFSLPTSAPTAPIGRFFVLLHPPMLKKNTFVFRTGLPLASAGVMENPGRFFLAGTALIGDLEMVEHLSVTSLKRDRVCEVARKFANPALGVARLGWVVSLIAGCGAGSAGGSGGRVLDGGPDVIRFRPTPPVVQVVGCEDDDCLCLSEPEDFEHAESLSLLNEYRVANGLSQLEYSYRLQAAADAHAQNLYELGFFDHKAPDGSRPADRAWAVGFCHELVGENIAYGLNSRATPLEVFQRLQASPGHDDNMLFEPYRYVGIGYYSVETEQGMEYWWVQLFAME